VHELNAKAALVDPTGIDGGLSTTIARTEIEGALRDEAPPQLELDVRRGEDAQTVTLTWTRDDLERLLREAASDRVTLTFDREAIEQAFDDVEGHGLRTKAAVIAVAVSAAAGMAGGASAMPMNEGPGSAVVTAPVNDPAALVDGWQLNAAPASGGTAAVVNDRTAALVDGWQLNADPASGGSAAASGATADLVDGWQLNADPASGGNAAASGATADLVDGWQLNADPASGGTAAASGAAADLVDGWQLNADPASGGTAAANVAAADGSSVIRDAAPIVGAAGLGAMLLIAGAAFVTTNRRRIPAT
jgi:hypothetical protein